MTISFYLTRPGAKGETSIFARISYSGNQLKYYTPESINPKHWSKETKLAKQTKEFKEYPEFNQRLKDWKTEVANIYRKWVNDNSGTIPNRETFKNLLDQKLKKIEPEKETQNTFLGFFQNIIDQTKAGARLQPKTGKPYTPATIQVYQNTLNRLKTFAPLYKGKIDFDTITIDFHTHFTGHLSNTLNLAANTIGKDVKTIKTILNEATERGLNTNLLYKRPKFSVSTENTDAIYLTETEIAELQVLDLTGNSRLEKVRDLFLVGCHTGLRFSDCSALAPEHMKDGFIEITQQKTGSPVAIPVHPTVQKILDKYNGHLPAAISNQKTNDYLKEIGKMLECLKLPTSRTITKGGMKVKQTFQRWELLSTHTARRSFATNEYKGGLPAITIMAITGHKTEKAFLRYIKLTPLEQAKIMKLHWEKRAALKVV